MKTTDFEQGERVIHRHSQKRGVFKERIGDLRAWVNYDDTGPSWCYIDNLESEPKKAPNR